MVNNVLDLAQQDVPLKQTSTCKGAEYHGPCPSCGGTDRFCVWPERGKTGRFWCRQCGRKGDSIQYLRDFRGLSFLEAKQRLGLPITSSPYRQADRAAIDTARERYFTWEHECLIEVTDSHRELLPQRWQAELSCDAFPEERALWTRKRENLDEQIESLQYDLKIFTYREYESERFARWAAEQSKKEAA